MSLRRYTLFIIVVVTLGLIGVVLINTTTILKNYFEQQEKNEIYLNVQQVKNALNQQATFLEKTGNDLSNWDDTYRFMGNGDPQFIEDHFQPVNFQNLDVDLMILVNTKFETVLSGVIGKNGQLSDSFPSEIKDLLQSQDPFFSRPEDRTSKHGLMVINRQPMMVVSHPILKTDHSGPSAGTLLIGKFLTSEYLENIANLLSLSVEIHPVVDVRQNSGYAEAVSFAPNEKDPYYTSLTSNDAFGYALVNDIDQKPTLILRIQRFPAVYNNGLLINNYLIISVVMICITFGTILFLLIEFNVLRPIRQLSDDVQSIGISGDLHQRVMVKRKDELSLLAAKINDMLAALESANLQVRNRIHELGALFNISQQLLGEIEEDTISRAICQLAVEQIGMDAAWIGAPSPDGSVLKPVASHGVVSETLQDVALFSTSDRSLHPAAVACNQKELILFSHQPAAPDSLAAGAGENTGAAFPLVQTGMTLAVLVLIKSEKPFISAESLPLIRAYVNLASVAMQNAYLFKQVLKGRERLQSISKQLVEVQEEERRKIALELHDEIGQILTGLRFSVDMFNTLPAEKIKSQVQQSVGIINDLIARVRQISLGLRPSMLDDLGIVPTLFWYLDRYTSQTGIQVVFQHNGMIDQRFSPEIEITVYRVIQEALTNVARHAKVQSANVRLWRTEKVIGIQVEDEGVGFLQDQVFSAPYSKGLLGMRERLGFLRGQLQIVTQPGEGTCLTAEIPLDDHLERRKHERKH